MRLSRKQWEWDRTITFAEQKQSSSVFEAKAKADQVKTTQQRMLRHHPVWPLGGEIRTGSPGPSGGQSTGASASASVLPVNIQG